MTTKEPTMTHQPRRPEYLSSQALATWLAKATIDEMREASMRLSGKILREQRRRRAGLATMSEVYYRSLNRALHAIRKRRAQVRQEGF